MTTTDGPGALNAETSHPAERATHDLPPKSYAEATIETFEEQQEANGHSAHVNKHPETASSSSGTASNVNGFAPAQGETKQHDDDHVIYAHHLDSNGTSIASVKPGPTYEEALKHNVTAAPRQTKNDTTIQKKHDPAKAQLASGRRAGAGWGKSAYVCSISWGRCI